MAEVSQTTEFTDIQQAYVYGFVVLELYKWITTQIFLCIVPKY